MAGWPPACGPRCCAAPGFPTRRPTGAARFRFLLLPAATPADAIAAGYELNLPPAQRSGSHGVTPLVSVDGDTNVLIESVKLADDRSGDVVVRLYEAEGVPGTATVRTSFAAAAFVRTDLLERPSGVDDDGPACAAAPVPDRHDQDPARAEIDGRYIYLAH